MGKIDVYGCTHVGLVRTHNEDHLLIVNTILNAGDHSCELRYPALNSSTNGWLFVIADGMGGYEGGEIASLLVLQTIQKAFLLRTIQESPEEIKSFLEEILFSANAAVMSRRATDSELADMGSTVTGILLHSVGFYDFNAGDSRVYRFRNGMLKLLTRDDTADEMVRRASLDPGGGNEQDRRLTNCLGHAHFTPWVQAGPSLRSKDILLLCSDGLHGLVSEDRIEELLSMEIALDEIGARLVDEALGHGGLDNISIILLRFEEI